ncbi:uncharacterized protein LOC5576905 [Aedes aegypti]|uniref:Uncharacterized protein n=1 Tax=Aedes aegypti TaxID=7159 RepID=A0A1S4FXB6_AEDAE|nr:uncharacterized protein LOC5576905 [Aedes aegypti]
MESGMKYDVENATTLAEWKKPLLVTFVFLTVIITGFVSYTYIYFEEIHQRMNTNASLAKEAIIIPSGAEIVEKPRESREANPCEDDSYRSWETYDLNETRLIYRLDPDENFFYFNRPQGPEFVVNNYVCDELKPFGTQLFLRMFEEMQSTFGFDHARGLLTRANQSENPWTWTELDSRRYFVNFRNSVLSYVMSAPTGNDPHPFDSSEGEWSNARSFQFECPGIKIADDLGWIEMGWIANGHAKYPDRDAENLLEFSAVFKSINAWRMLADDCIANYLQSSKNLKIMSYCDCPTEQINCTKNTCTKIWQWPLERLVSFKIWYTNGQWNLAYRYGKSEGSDEIESN